MPFYDKAKTLAEQTLQFAVHGKDAASAGFYPNATGRKYPHLQLLTIDGLMTGHQRAEHPDAAPVNFKQARKEATSQQGELL